MKDNVIMINGKFDIILFFGLKCRFVYILVVGFILNSCVIW